MKSLENLAPRFRICEQCGTCTAACHVSDSGTFNVRRLIRHVHLDLLEEEFLATQPWQCAGCGRCSRLCTEGLDIVELVYALRRLARDRGLEPEGAQALVDAVLNSQSPFQAVGKTKRSWIEKGSAPSEGSDTLYWAGCAASFMLPRVARATAKVLIAARGSYQVLENEPCCGEPLLALGREEEALEAAKEAVAAIRDSGAKEMVVSCSGCFSTFTRHYPETLGLSLEGIRILHLAELLAESPLPARLPKSMTVAYHDPCSLVRTAEVVEEPRMVLKSIEGLTLREFEPQGVLSVCCGGGGGIWALENKEAVAQGRRKLARSIEPLGVDALVTCCPVCHLNFRRSLRAARSKMKILDLAEIMALALAGNEG